MTAEFEQLPPREQAPTAGEHFHHWHTPDGVIVASFYRTPGGYLLRFPGRADFTIAAGSHDVTCAPVPGAAPTVLSALYFNQVLPLLCSLDGALVIHGSAVSIGSSALAFVGPSGRGKSTLAAAFARAGRPFLSDDGVWLECSGSEHLVSPHRPGLRLWPDSEIAVLEASEDAEGAERVEKGYRSAGPDLPFEDRSRPLQALYLLGEGTCANLTIEPLNHSTAVVELIKAAFILDAEDRQRHEAHFERIAALAGAIPCFALDYRRRYESLPRVIEGILAHAETGVSNS